MVFDDLSTGHRKFVRYGDFVEGDIRETEFVEETLRGQRIEAVVHFAAKSIVPESVANPALYHSVNVEGTRSILDAMKRTGVKRLVFSSSAATYGQPLEMPIQESSEQRPLNPYGATKLESEKLILASEKQNHMRVAALRYFNVIGCDPECEIWEDHNPETHLVPSLVKALSDGREFSLFGQDYPTRDGTTVRDYVDVNDLASVHLRALEMLENKTLLVSNVGTGKGQTVLEIFKAFENVFGRAPVLKNKPRREGDPAELVADATFFQSWYPRPLMTLAESFENLKKLGEMQK